MVHVSLGMNGKLEHIPAINTNPLTNSYCITRREKKDKSNICTYCYNFYMLEKYRKNALDAFEKNSKELSGGILEDYDLPRIYNTLCVRFNAFGELINHTHLVNLIRICELNPRTMFGLWTKRFSIVESVLEDHIKPDNLIIILSNCNINTVLEPQEPFDKTYNITTGEIESDCEGQCIDCMKCYTKHRQSRYNKCDIIVARLKKYGK